MTVSNFYLYDCYFYVSKNGYYYQIEQFLDMTSKISRISKTVYQELKSIKFGGN